MTLGDERFFRGVIDHSIAGRKVYHEAILCCPGDWAAIKAELDLDDSWATLRLGLFLLAEGPPRSDTIPGLPAWSLPGVGHAVAAYGVA